MLKKRACFSAGVVAIAFLLVSTPLFAFVITTGYADENVSGAGRRAPGNMVSAGVGRAQARADDFFSRTEVTQTEVPEGPFGEFLPEGIEIAFDAFNNALDLLLNALFIRAGEEPPLDLAGVPIVKERTEHRDVR